MGYIYKIINKINNKIYIGQTIRNPQIRWEEHCKKTDRCLALNNSINKYSKENFILEIICECSNDKLDELEIKYIKELNSLYPNGYNLTSGGQNNNKLMSEISRNRMRIKKIGKDNPNFGKERSFETKKKISDKKSGENHHFYGKELTPEHKLKLSKAQKIDDLPMYLVHLNPRPSAYQAEGYVVCNHPNGKNKYFTSSKLTIEEKYNQALEYLNKLNAL
jgi:group I intron endonuclease